VSIGEYKMPALLDNIDPKGLEEFSVVFTDRSLNHMSKEFQQVMRDLSLNLKEVYNSSSSFSARWWNVCYGSSCAAVWY